MCYVCLCVFVCVCVCVCVLLLTQIRPFDLAAVAQSYFQLLRCHALNFLL